MSKINPAVKKSIKRANCVPNVRQDAQPVLQKVAGSHRRLQRVDSIFFIVGIGYAGLGAPDIRAFLVFEANESSDLHVFCPLLGLLPIFCSGLG